MPAHTMLILYELDTEVLGSYPGRTNFDKQLFLIGSGFGVLGSISELISHSHHISVI